MIQLGQYPAPVHVIAHVSDTHFLGGDRKLFGSVDTDAHLKQALEQLERSGASPEAIVFTGDLADLGEPDAYTRLRSIVEPAAERMGAQIIWVMGNHDERADYARLLFDEIGTDEMGTDETGTDETGAGSASTGKTSTDVPGTHAPQDRVYDINGLRIISLDSTVPGYHHGEISAAQLEWLAGVLSVPAQHGTILALHHPPIPTPRLEAMAMLELLDQGPLADVIRGTDVRTILAGHLHYSSHSTFAGIPVSVASATCYTLDLTAKDRILSGRDDGQSINLVHVYEEQIVHSIVPLGDGAEVTGVPSTGWAQIEGMTPEERLEMFSNKNSPFNRGEIPV